jgi:hypothetical protein
MKSAPRDDWKGKVAVCDFDAFLLFLGIKILSYDVLKFSSQGTNFLQKVACVVGPLFCAKYFPPYAPGVSKTLKVGITF